MKSPELFDELAARARQESIPFGSVADGVIDRMRERVPTRGRTAHRGVLVLIDLYDREG